MFAVSRSSMATVAATPDEPAQCLCLMLKSTAANKSPSTLPSSAWSFNSSLRLSFKRHFAICSFAKLAASRPCGPCPSNTPRATLLLDRFTQKCASWPTRSAGFPVLLPTQATVPTAEDTPAEPRPPSDEALEFHDAALLVPVAVLVEADALSTSVGSICFCFSGATPMLMLASFVFFRCCEVMLLLLLRLAVAERRRRLKVSMPNNGEKRLKAALQIYLNIHFIAV
mmetsp:Transcript_70952/g.169932  ORF Transcript_70952/g.169932 Transcript_70952/m.169932 type:complete len:227 (-) Transcript_70952:43-723(-)